MALRCRMNLVCSHPYRTLDAGIQSSKLLMHAQLARKCEAQVTDVAERPRTQIDADQRRRAEDPRGFLQRLAGARGDQRLTMIEMAGRLIEAQAILGFLFYKQEASFEFDQRGDGNIGLPDAIHPRILAPLLKSAPQGL